MYEGQAKTVSEVQRREIAGNEEAQDHTRVLWLRLGGQEDWQKKQQTLLHLLGQYPGPYDLYLYLEAEKQRLKAPACYRISKSTALVHQLEALLGAGSVVWR